MSFLDRLLDRLLGTPTLQTVIRDVVRALRQQGCTEIQASEERMEVRSRQGTLALGNLLFEIQKAPRRERAAVLDRFVGALMHARDDTPKDYASVRPRLMPVVRSIGGMGIAGLSVSGAKADATPDMQPARRPLVADLVIALVVDHDNAMSYVQERALADWGISWEQALADAMDNLRGLPEHGGWQQAAPGVWSGEWGDSYESSRLLIPDLIYRLGIADPIAMVPFRHALLVTSAGNAAGLAAMVKIAHEALDTQGRWLSFELLRLGEDRRWTPFALAGESASQQAEMNLRSLAADYDGQRQILLGHFEDQRIDIFVANFNLMQKEGQPLTSYAVWSEGVDTLLPQTESVVMLYPEGEEEDSRKHWHARLPWATVREHFGHLMEATEHLPPRYRVQAFPEREVLHALAAAANLD